MKTAKEANAPGYCADMEYEGELVGQSVDRCTHQAVLTLPQHFKCSTQSGLAARHGQ